MTLGPQRIVCLTEETTEWLYLLGQESRIVGISGYTVRPRRAREEKPRVSAFTSAKIDKILALQPDCVLGFSDMQADIAAALIRAGVQVTVFNQRSVAEIFSVLYQVAAMVGQGEQGLALMADMQQQLVAIAKAAATLPRRPKIYFEEWDMPHISAIRWVSELMGIAGGDDCFPELTAQSLGKHRIIADGAVEHDGDLPRRGLAPQPLLPHGGSERTRHLAEPALRRLGRVREGIVREGQGRAGRTGGGETALRGQQRCHGLPEPFSALGPG